MDAPTELVAQFLPVELKQDPSAERSVVDVSQDVQRLDDAPQFRQGLGQGRWAVFDLQHAHDACGLEVAELDRPGQTDQVGPVFPNQIDFDPAPGNLIELSVARLRSEEHTSELQSLMRISYAVFCLKKQKKKNKK